MGTVDDRNIFVFLKLAKLNFNIIISITFILTYIRKQALPLCIYSTLLYSSVGHQGCFYELAKIVDGTSVSVIACRSYDTLIWSL